MPRYRGQQSTKAVERDFPHIVEIEVPSGGLGTRMNLMSDWHKARGIESQRGQGRYEEPTWFARWCFADQATAEAFHAEFGGKIVIPPMPNDPAAAMDWAKTYIQGD